MRPVARLLILGILSCGVSAAEGTLPSEAERLEQNLRVIEGIRADFVQIRAVSLTGETIEAQGYLAFRPPQEFRLVYSEPDSQELVIRGDSLWVVIFSENQVQRYPFTDGAPGSEVFLLFGGRSRSLEEAFIVEQESWGSYARALRLTPREEDPGYPLEEIRLVVGANGFPQKLFFREVTGDTVVFNFTRMVKNPSDIESLTQLRLPPGIEIIEGGPAREGGGLPIDTEND